MTLPLLFEGLDLPEPIAALIERLRAVKRGAVEGAEGPRIPELDVWLEAQFAWAREALAADPPPRGQGLTERASAVFKRIVLGA
jgi:hypothetical protein